MQCLSCGTELGPGDVFCGGCGADVRAVVAAPPAAAPPPPLPVAAAVAAAPPPLPTSAPQGAPPPPFPAQPDAPGAKKGLSTGAIIGIVAGALVFLLVLGAGGFVTYRIFAPKKPTVAVVTSKPGTKPVTTPEPTTSATESAVPGAETPAPGAATPAKDAIVTDAEARAVVKKFMDTRAANDIAGSKAFCSKNMLTGENGSFVNDKWWKPDSYKIIKTTPDLMFIHVTTMGEWPSGSEPTIYSVWRNPESGKVLIDGMLDPEMFPELVKP